MERSKGFSAILVLIAVVTVVGIIAAVMYFKNTQSQPTTSMPSVEQSSSTSKNDNSPSSLEAEATSIKIDDVDSNFSDIDKDLQELK